MGIGREFYQLLRLYGGLAVEYLDLTEGDFAASAGLAYTPPEEGTHRRIVPARTIQCLAQCPVVVETFQATAAVLRLPSSTVSEDTNDAANGRHFIINNSGSGALVIQDYQGAVLHTLRAGRTINIHGHRSNQWQFDYTHDLTAMPSTFRDGSTEQILNDLGEEDSGKGFTEVTYIGAFVSNITTWWSAAKTKKRTEVDLTYSPVPFTSTVVKRFYDEDGVAVVSTVTSTVTYNANKTVQNIDTVVTRP